MSKNKHQELLATLLRTRLEPDTHTLQTQTAPTDSSVGSASARQSMTLLSHGTARGEQTRSAPRSTQSALPDRLSFIYWLQTRPSIKCSRQALEQPRPNHPGHAPLPDFRRLAEGATRRGRPPRRGCQSLPELTASRGLQPSPVSPSWTAARSGCCRTPWDVTAQPPRLHHTQAGPERAGKSSRHRAP